MITHAILRAAATVLGVVVASVLLLELANGWPRSRPPQFRPSGSIAEAVGDPPLLRLDATDPGQVVAFANSEAIANLVEEDVKAGGLPKAFILHQAMRAEDVDATWTPFATSAIENHARRSLGAPALLHVECRTNICEFQFVSARVSDPEEAHRLLDAIEKFPVQPWWHSAALDQWSGRAEIAGGRVAALYFSLRCPGPAPDLCAPACSREIRNH